MPENTIDAGTESLGSADRPSSRLNVTLQYATAADVRAVDLTEAYGSDLVSLKLGDLVAEVCVLDDLDAVTAVIAAAAAALDAIKTSRQAAG